MQPRIYVYKITFQEAPLYYFGVHKERTFNEEYMGSPITHKEKWQTYTPQKEILREFDYTDDGWLQAQDFEKELIRPAYNIDNNCLNESCGPRISLAINRAIGKKVWEDKTPEQRSKWLSRTTEQRSAAAKKAIAAYLANSTPEQRSDVARKANATKFQCTITGHISNAGPLALYQRARGIDTSNRVKVIPSSVAS